MAQYRASALDLSTRIAIGLEMLKPVSERGWGRATELAQQYSISRTWLYELRDRARAGLEAALRARRPGPQPQSSSLVVDNRLIKRMTTCCAPSSVTLLPMVNGGRRDIQLVLDVCLGVSRSVGSISETLQSVGTAAHDYNGQIQFPEPVLGEADEIFQGGQPCLSVVDGHSFAVLRLRPAEKRDAVTWAVTFLDLEDQDVEMQDLVSDGARGIRAGLRESGLDVPLRPDLVKPHKVIPLAPSQLHTP